MSLSSLDVKIKTLFEYREFPFLYDIAKANYNLNDQLLPQLFELQSVIYNLDNYLETNWVINPSELNQYWDEINNVLILIGVKPAKIEQYTAHIKKYQKHELELRKSYLPTRFKTEFFYFYKSCDVKLIRRIIYDQFPFLKREASLGDWRFFDLITEINDDVTDVFEDVQTINGNCFLISYYNEGTDYTSKRFIKFSNNLLERAKLKYEKSKKTTMQKMIYEKTKCNIQTTLELITKNIKILNQIPRSDVKLFNFLEVNTKKTG